MNGSNSYEVCHGSNRALTDGESSLSQLTSVQRESETSVNTLFSQVRSSELEDLIHFKDTDDESNNGDSEQKCSVSQPFVSSLNHDHLVSTPNVSPTYCAVIANNDEQLECFITPGVLFRGVQSGKTTYTNYCWPPVKVILPERSSMTAEIFSQVDNKVCQLYTLFTNHYQFWLKTREDYRKPCSNREHTLCLERKLQTLEQYLANIHVDLERYVTIFEVQAAVSGCVRSFLSSWQKKNLIAVRHHLTELRKLQKDAEPNSQLYAARQQKILGLIQQESLIISELLVPRLPADSPGNDARCLSVLLHNSVVPIKIAFICKKISAINKLIRRSAIQQPNEEAVAVQQRAG